ncbi:MAG: glycosyltransferase family 4 protein [Acidobacteriota bacterium]|nr:glycosyltransferase family 4 protein [Acidobacteriota bacterium]
MRILLTSNASYDPPRGGSTRSNMTWLRRLVSEAHMCEVVSAAWGEEGVSDVDGIRIRSVRNLPRRTLALRDAIESFHPDCTLVSSEDLSHMLLREAARATPAQVVYLAHTPQFFPFGPESWNPDPHATALLREAQAVISIGQHMAGYIAEHCGINSRVIHPPIYGQPPFPNFGRFDSGYVLTINPCSVKGISIFLELARRFPHLSFAALSGWGTTSRDQADMAQLPNVRLLESVPNIEQVLSGARLLVMPSLWYEGFGLIAMEAMLRGLPVIASDSGGLTEAKAGTGYVIPVQPISTYLPEFDEVHMPRPAIPPQNFDPWVRALTELTTDRAAYEREAERSRTAAAGFVSRLDGRQLGRFLEALRNGQPSRKSPLTAAQKAILVQRLRERGCG